MTVAGTDDRSSGLGHIPAATTGTLTRDWLSVFALCLLELQTVIQSTECVKCPLSSSLLLHRFFLPAERDQDSSLLPRSSLFLVTSSRGSSSTCILHESLISKPPSLSCLPRMSCNQKSTPSPSHFFLAPHLILAWLGVFDLVPTDLLMVGDTVTLPTDLRHPAVC